MYFIFYLILDAGDCNHVKIYLRITGVLDNRGWFTMFFWAMASLSHQQKSGVRNWWGLRRSSSVDRCNMLFENLKRKISRCQFWTNIVSWNQPVDHLDWIVVQYFTQIFNWKKKCSFRSIEGLKMMQILLILSNMKLLKL